MQPWNSPKVIEDSNSVELRSFIKDEKDDIKTDTYPVDEVKSFIVQEKNEIVVEDLVEDSVEEDLLVLRRNSLDTILEDQHDEESLQEKSSIKDSKG